MRIGVNLPYHALSDDTDLYAEYATRAEALGFTHLVALDHVMGPVHADRDPPLEGPYTEQTLFREPFVLLAWLGALTTSLELTTGVIVLPQRQTVLAAKQAAELQMLTKGRLRLGVGSGWNYVEYESLDVPYRGRGARLNEQIDVLRQLWTGDVLDLRGQFHRIDRASMIPAPPDIPIWFGGFSRAQQDRCAAKGDGFLFTKFSSLSVSAIGTIRQGAAERGRDPDRLGFEAGFATGNDLPSDIDRWAAAGGTHAYVRVEGVGAEALAELERLAAQLGSRLTGST